MTIQRRSVERKWKVGTYPCLNCGVGIECCDPAVRCCVNCREKMYEDIAEILVPGYDRNKMNDWPKELEILWGEPSREIQDKLKV